MRERLGPMGVAADAGRFQSGLFQSLEHFVGIHMAHWLHAFKAGCLDGPELIEDRAFESDGGVHDGFLERAFLWGGLGERAHLPERGYGERAAAAPQEVTPVESVCHEQVLIWMRSR